MSDAKPKKSGFFKKPAWLTEKAKEEVKPEEKKDATQMFARSVGTVSDILAEQKRKEALRAEKKAKSKEKEKEAAESPRNKHRKLSEDEDYDEDSKRKKDSISPRRTISTIQKSADSSPTSLSKRYDAALHGQKKRGNIIQLSDGESSDDGSPDSTLTTKRTRTEIDTTTISMPQDDSQKEDEDEEFAKIAAAVRARARQQEQAKKSSTLVNGHSELPNPVDTGPNPTIDLLVWSPIEDTIPLLVKRKYLQNFRDIRKAWLERQTTLPHTTKDAIYFTWRDKRIFDVATIKSLGIKLDEYGNAIIPTDQGKYKDSEERIVLCATTDAQVRLEKEEDERLKRQKQREEEGEVEVPPPVQAPKIDGIRIVLRARGFTDQKLIVKPVCGV
jgi:hypothetical protein